MKYIKVYEEIIDRQPKVGDYIICKDNKELKFRKMQEIFDEYVQTHVGRIVKVNDDNLSSHQFVVQYDPMPTDYKLLDYGFFTSDRQIVDGINYKTLKIDRYTFTNITSFQRDEILFFSDNREIVEAYMESNINQIKFNL